MSAESLRKAVIEQLEKLNADEMMAACNVRPTLTTSSDGLAMTVVDHLAMARAFALCAALINAEYRKLVTPTPEPASKVTKIREVY